MSYSCTNCGTSLVEASEFCTKCGKKCRAMVVKPSIVSVLRRIFLITSLLVLLLVLAIGLKVFFDGKAVRSADARRRQELTTAKPLKVNPLSLVGTWYGRGGTDNGVEVRLLITTDVRPTTGGGAFASIDIVGLGEGCDYSSVQMSGGSDGTMLKMSGYLGHVGNGIEKGSYTDWEDTDTFILNAKLEPMGMSDGLMVIKTDRPNCPSRMSFPFKLSLVETPTVAVASSPSPTPEPNPAESAQTTAQPPDSTVKITSEQQQPATLEIVLGPKAQVIKQFPPKFTVLDGQGEVTVKVEGRYILELNNPDLYSLPNHRVITCSKRQMACQVSDATPSMQSGDRSGIEVRGPNLVAIPIRALAIPRPRPPFLNHSRIDAWLVLRGGGYTIRATTTYPDCGGERLIINSSEQTVTTVSYGACSSGSSSESEGFLVDGNYNMVPEPTQPPREEQAPAPEKSTWTDPATGLMWTARDNGSDVNSNEATNYCATLKVGAYSDWRLSNFNELRNLYDPHNTSTMTDSSGRQVNYHIKNGIVLTGQQWSATQTSPGRGWLFAFVGGGQVPSLLEARLDARALCVRHSDQ